MTTQVERKGCLYQDDAADYLRKHFGKAFADDNDTGGMSIAKDVLAAFRAMTAKTIVWDRGERPAEALPSRNLAVQGAGGYLCIFWEAR